MTTRLAQLSADLVAEHPLSHELWIDIAGVLTRVASSSTELHARLADYFGDAVVPAAARPDVQVNLLEARSPRLPIELRDWPREPGKQGKKERYADAVDGRLVLKVRTGMHFLLTATQRFAIGPCIANLNQVVNFIIAQYIDQRLDEGWLLCHAAAVTLGAQGLAIAARSGAGKSTLALHLMNTGLSFASNDRLLLRRSGERCELCGVPKMPRVNPGTLLRNPQLAGLVSPRRRMELENMPASDLWRLEEKHDVMIRDVYGPGRTSYRAPLRALVVLGWSLDATSPVRITPVDLASRPDLLEHVMKSPGVFHRQGNGALGVPHARPDAQAYLRALGDVPVYEAAGKADFDVGVGFCRRLLER